MKAIFIVVLLNPSNKSVKLLNGEDWKLTTSEPWISLANEHSGCGIGIETTGEGTWGGVSGHVEGGNLIGRSTKMLWTINMQGNVIRWNVNISKENGMVKYLLFVTNNREQAQQWMW